MNGIAAILPAFNEEVSIGSVVLRTRRYVDRVIVVDDGSSDRTSEIAELAGAEVIRHQLNMGKGAALKTGFEFLDSEMVVVTIDTDGADGLLIGRGGETLAALQHLIARMAARIDEDVRVHVGLVG